MKPTSLRPDRFPLRHCAHRPHCRPQPRPRPCRRTIGCADHRLFQKRVHPFERALGDAGGLAEPSAFRWSQYRRREFSPNTWPVIASPVSDVTRGLMVWSASGIVSLETWYLLSSSVTSVSRRAVDDCSLLRLDFGLASGRWLSGTCRILPL